MSIHRLVQSVTDCLHSLFPRATPTSASRDPRSFGRATTPASSERLEGRTLLSSVPAGPPVTIADALVRVTQVFVNGPGLTGQTSANGVTFRNLAGIDNTFGYPVPDVANQLKYIPWTGGIDRIAI